MKRGWTRRGAAVPEPPTAAAGKRTGRAARRALAATAALCAVAAAPGTATADPGDVPEYRTAENAEQVDGAASSADGPRLRHGQTYTDTIRPGEKKYYTVELDDTSQPWISAAALPRPGSEVSYRDGIRVTLEATDGTECSREESTIVTDGAAWPIAASVTRFAGAQQCQEGGVYNVSVSRDVRDDVQGAAWPLELRLQREPGLKAAGPTEAPEDEADSETEPPSMPTGEPESLRGGTSFNDAVGMGAGVWKDRLRPGETRFYRVPVDWGQALALRAEFGTAKVTDDTGFVSQGVHMEVHNPARAPVSDKAESYRAGDPAAVPLQTPRVRYAGRFAYEDDVAAASVAGWYYVAVHAHPGLDEFVQGGVPVTLRTKLVGKPVAGPAYDGDATAAGFGVGADEREQAERGLTPQAAERSAFLTRVGWSAIGGGTVLVVGLGLWTLLARRRSGGSPASVSTGPAAAGVGGGVPPVDPYEPTRTAGTPRPYGTPPDGGR